MCLKSLLETGPLHVNVYDHQLVLACSCMCLLICPLLVAWDRKRHSRWLHYLAHLLPTPSLPTLLSCRTRNRRTVTSLGWAGEKRPLLEPDHPVTRSNQGKRSKGNLGGKASGKCGVFDCGGVSQGSGANPCGLGYRKLKHWKEQPCTGPL